MKSTELAKLFGDYYNPKDEEWSIILEKLNETGIEMSGVYKVAYLRNMEKLCHDIKTDQAFGQDRVLTVGLIRKLYNLADLFYCFDIRMKKYNSYALEHDLAVATYEWINEYPSVPGCHNFYAFLNDMTYWKLDNYYMKVVDSILSYTSNQGNVLPEYMPTLEKRKRGKDTYLIVVKNKLIRDIGMENKELRLPGYYPVNQKISTNPEDYRALFSQEESYQSFMKKEFPIYKWIMENVYEGT